jgi:hypothetical protein
LKSQIEMIEEPRDRRFADHNLLLRQQRPEFRQRDVWPLRNPPLGLLFVSFQRIAFVPAKFLRAHIASGR